MEGLRIQLTVSFHRHLSGRAVVQGCRAATIPLVLALWPRAVDAQALGRVAGVVTDSAGSPVRQVQVEVLDSYWSTVTSIDGSFELRVPAGQWLLRFSRIGYRTDTLAVEVQPARDSSPLRLRLASAPVELEGLTVQPAGAVPLGMAVTSETVRQVPPLGEPDIFRAVVLLPTISQPNDLKGRIHLAGGSSDETGVRLDGHPLHDPFHLLGLFGAFNVAALERAEVLIGHVPPSFGGRLSGVVDLTTKRPSPEPSQEVVASVLTAGATASRSDLPWSIDALISGRVTYLDQIAPLVFDDVPKLGFYDGLVRLGRSWSGWRAEALAFTTRDFFRDDELEDFAEYEPLTWGESLVGLRLTGDRGAWTINARASFNRATVHLDERFTPAGRSNFIDSERDWWSAMLEIGRNGSYWRGSLGAELARRTNDQRWSARGLIDELFSPNTPEEFEGRQSLSTLALFGEAGVRLAERWDGSVGARLWRARNDWYPSPRVTLGYRLGEGLRLEAAAGRRFQFDAQLEPPIEGSVATPLFLLDQPRRADVAAFTLEWAPPSITELGDGSLRIEAFAKRYPDRTVLVDREPGVQRSTLGEGFPEFNRIRGSSMGAAVAGRLAWGEGWLVEGSYTYQRVREEHEGDLYPTSWDAPHALSLFTSIPFKGWTLNLVYQGRSGVAITPVLGRSFEPYTNGTNDFLRPRYVLGERNSLRLPAYSRLDVGARRGWKGWGAEWTFFFQVLNVLFHENFIEYDWTAYYLNLADGAPNPAAGRSGLPIVPSLGVEVKW